ncbi:MAG TPA: alpha/beta hydrolase [Acidiferrobacterales bacterium]
MLTGVVTVLAALVVLNGWMYLQQPAMIFFPTRALAATPADWGLAYQDVELTAADGVALHGWYLPRAGARRVLLFFHGNAGNISHRRESIEIFHRLGLDVFIIDYRGYGRSAGRPGEAGLYRDADAAWKYLTTERGVREADIVVFGRSLGGAVAAELASRTRPGTLILESTFPSARAAARSVFPLLARLIVLRFGFDTAAHLQTVSCPVLVLHSPDDEIMPFALGERVFQAARAPKDFVRLRGDHNSGFLASQPEYTRALAGFLARHAGAQDSRQPQGARP